MWLGPACQRDGPDPKTRGMPGGGGFEPTQACTERECEDSKSSFLAVSTAGIQLPLPVAVILGGDSPRRT